MAVDRKMTLILIGFLLAFLGILSWIWVRSGSLHAMSQFVQGDRIVLVNRVSDMGEIEPLSKTKVRFEIRNMGSEPSRLIGSQASCSCTILSDRLPIRIEQGSSHWIELEYRAPKEVGSFSKTLTLYTDSRSPSRLELEIRGNVVKKPRALSLVR